MANAITRTTPYQSRTAGNREMCWLEGRKAAGAIVSSVNQNGVTVLKINSLSGVAEENIVESGIGTANTYNDGSGNRPCLTEAGQNFRTTCCKQMPIVNTTTGLIHVAHSFGAAYHDTRLKTGTAWPNLNTYEVHGFAKLSPTNWLNHFHSNMIFIDSGKGAGSVQEIKTIYDDGTDAYLVLWGTIPDLPDNTSTFIIPWGLLDIIWASDAGGWGWGNITMDLKGHRPLLVQTLCEVEIGKSGTPTYFGFNSVHLNWYRQTHDICIDGWGDSHLTRNNEAIVFWGAGDYGADIGVTPNPRGTAIIGGHNHNGWGANMQFGWELGNDTRLARGQAYGEISFGGDNSYALHARNVQGKIWSFHNRELRSVPNTMRSILEYCKWSGGTWGAPLSIAIVGSNGKILSLRGEIAGGTATANFAGWGWLGQNSGGTGDYFIEPVDMSIGSVGNFKDGAGRDCDYWGIYKWSTYEWHYFNKKILRRSVLNKQSKLPMAGIKMTITDVLGNIVSERYSGADVAERVDKTETVIDVTDDAPFSIGQTLRNDNEYWYVTAVTPGTPDTITVIRKYRLGDTTFPGLPHEFDLDTYPSYDKRIFIVEPLYSDNSGEYPEHWLHWCSMDADSTGSGYPMQVTHNGVNYTCKLKHQATAATEPGVGGSWGTYWNIAGDEGFPWVLEKYYTDGADGPRSWNEHRPYIIIYQRPGVEGYSEIWDPDHDASIETIGSARQIELLPRRFIEKQSREGV